MKVNAFMVFGINPHPEDRVLMRRIYKALRRDKGLSKSQANIEMLRLAAPHLANGDPATTEGDETGDMSTKTKK